MLDHAGAFRNPTWRAFSLLAPSQLALPSRLAARIKAGTVLDAGRVVKIAELSVFAVRIPLRRAIRHASHRRTLTENLVARCVLADGTTGYGEGVPRDYVTGETVASALDLLARSGLAAQLSDCVDFPAAVALAGRLHLVDVPGDERGIGGNAARCAVELALLDAYGRHFGQPLSRVTQLAAPDCFSPRPWVRYSGAITSARGFKLRLVALVQWLFGFRQLKLKVGIAGQDDVERLRVLRRCVGSKVDLRVDANEAWPPDEAARRIRALAAFGITAVEQPVAHEQIACLAEIRQQVTVPIMLDESLCGPRDAERIIREGLGDLFNIRLSKC